MLRLTVLLLVLANAAYFVWSQGVLAPWGLAPAQQSEPQRMQQQIKPQLVRVLGGEEARRLQNAGKSPECLQAGLFEDAQAASLKQALDPWPVGSWLLEPGVEPPRWIVYLGKFPAADYVGRKKAELRQLGVSFEDLSNPSLEPGLALGGFATEAAAGQHLQELAQLGVRSAKVVQERPETRGQLLKLPAVDDNLKPRLEGLRAALNGRPLRPCR
jgi:hypothetical protein